MNNSGSEPKSNRPANIVVGITVLLAYQLFGEIVVVVFGLPFPGPVVGMLALFVTLAVRGGWRGNVEQTATGLLRHFSLLFVPAGVGVMVHMQRMSSEWVPVVAALVFSTVIGLVVSASLMQWICGLKPETEDE